MTFKVGDLVSPEEDFLMEDGEVSYTTGEVYEIMKNLDDIIKGDFNIVDDQGCDHLMDNDTLIKNKFKKVSGKDSPEDAADRYDRAMSIF